MLNSKLTKIIMFVRPNIKYQQLLLKKQLSTYYSFNYHTRAIPVEIIADKVVETITQIECLGLLANTIDTAVSLLDKIDQKIVKYLYYHKWSLGDTADKLGKQKSYVSYRNERAIKKLSNCIEILGFDKDTILNHFDKSELFIDCAFIQQGVENVE